MTLPVPHRLWVHPPKGTTVNQQLKAYLISLARLFVTACLAVYFTINKSPLELDFADGKAILAAGVAAILVSIFNALNPADKRYGNGAPSTRELSAGDVATNAAEPSNVRVTGEGGASTLELACVVSAVCLVLIVVFGTGLAR